MKILFIVRELKLCLIDDREGSPQSAKINFGGGGEMGVGIIGLDLLCAVFRAYLNGRPRRRNMPVRVVAARPRRPL